MAECYEIFKYGSANFLLPIQLFIYVIVTPFVFSAPVGYFPPAFLFRLTAILPCTK